MPGSVFHIVGIDGAMELELPAAILEPAGIVERNAPLPKLRLTLGNQAGNPIESGDGLRDPAGLKIGYRAVEDFLGIFTGSLTPGRGRERTKRDQNGAIHSTSLYNACSRM